jgi:hypothetical protein
MALAQDILTRIINVHWGGKVGFLYSGADGMFTSSDGNDWTRLESSVPAVSLAWVDGVWIGCGPGGVWRSEDGAQSWEPVGVPAFEQVAAMKPTGMGPDDKPKPGIFAGWREDDDGENQIVYTSLDLGKTWTMALTLPTNGGTDDGFEDIVGLSSGGEGIFVCTVWQSSSFHHGDGKIYSSIDGNTFSAETVFGPGNITLGDDPDQYPRIGFTAASVGYDAKTKQYIAVGDKNTLPSSGVNESYVIYTISSSSSFGMSAGTIADSGVSTPAGEQVGASATASATGGDGKFATGTSLFRFGTGGVYVNSDWKARFIPGTSQVLQTTEILKGGHVGSFCFKSDETSTDGEGSDQGVFACTAFGTDMAGGVYVTSGMASFVMKHSGTGIDIGGGTPRGAVAVGIVVS